MPTCPNSWLIICLVQTVKSQKQTLVQHQALPQLKIHKIAWVKSGSGSDEIITLTITDAVGNVTTMSVPLGDFKF